MDKLNWLTSWSWVSPSWEPTNCAATQEFPRILWNSKVHYSAHKNPPLVPILSQIGPVHTIPSYLSMIHFNIATHLRLGLLSGLFPFDFSSISYMHSSCLHLCYMPCLSHPPWLDHSNYTWRRAQVMKFLIMQFSLTSRHFLSLLLSTLFSNTLSLCSSLIMRPSFAPAIALVCYRAFNMWLHLSTVWNCATHYVIQFKFSNVSE
jgi:hypothetical protein